MSASDLLLPGLREDGMRRIRTRGGRLLARYVSARTVRLRAPELDALGVDSSCCVEVLLLPSPSEQLRAALPPSLLSSAATGSGRNAKGCVLSFWEACSLWRALDWPKDIRTHVLAADLAPLLSGEAVPICPLTLLGPTARPNPRAAELLGPRVSHLRVVGPYIQ